MGVYQKVSGYEKLIDYFGGLSKTATALKTSRQRVHQWKTRGIPASAAVEIEEITGGRLKVRNLLTMGQIKKP